MDETLSRRAALVLAACLLGGAASTASATDLQDPTRPPAAAGLVRTTDARAPAPEAAPSLQSVQVGQGAVRSAVIDGESVRVGASFRGARVVRIADNEVELLRGRERQVLRLYAPALDGAVTRAKGE